MKTTLLQIIASFSAKHAENLPTLPRLYEGEEGDKFKFAIDLDTYRTHSAEDEANRNAMLDDFSNSLDSAGFDSSSDYYAGSSQHGPVANWIIR